MSENSKMQLALRRNRGKQLLPKMLQDLSIALNRPPDQIHIADLDTTDKVWVLFNNFWAKASAGEILAIRKDWLICDSNDAKSYINRVVSQIADTSVFLFRPLFSEYCGAAVVSNKEVLNHAFDLIQLDDNDLLASTDDGSCGIVLSCTTNWGLEGSFQVYEYLAWGQSFESVK